jgi:hypothetical protein
MGNKIITKFFIRLKAKTLQDNINQQKLMLFKATINPKNAVAKAKASERITPTIKAFVLDKLVS